MTTDTYRDSYTGNYRERAWIVDIDGTLAHRICLEHPEKYDIEHICMFRSPYDDEKYELIMSDALDPYVSLIVNLLYNDGATILICSGRSEVARTVTQDWLHKHDIPYTNLFMRKAGDTRPDSTVKLEILDKYILPNFEVEGVLDDRPSVIRAWSSRGLKVFDVDPTSGEF